MHQYSIYYAHYRDHNMPTLGGLRNGRYPQTVWKITMLRILSQQYNTPTIHIAKLCLTTVEFPICFCKSYIVTDIFLINPEVLKNDRPVPNFFYSKLLDDVCEFFVFYDIF